jgi:uncharacterized phage-like protein YoqJ
MNDIAVAVTGHRPDKLGGYDFYNPVRSWVREQMKQVLLELQPKMTISGMALGVDQDWAHVSLEMRIPFLAAIPFVGQESQWPAESQRYYRDLMALAAWRYVVCEGGYAGYKMQRRNEWMVNQCHILVAVWDGSEGGTGNCVRYAQKVQREMRRINPKEFPHVNR